PTSTLFPYTTLFRSCRQRIRPLRRTLASLSGEFLCFGNDSRRCVATRIQVDALASCQRVANVVFDALLLDAGQHSARWFQKNPVDRKSTRLNSSHVK